MKEIKAYIRHEKAEEVVHALEEAGVSWITAVEVEEVGISADMCKAKYSIEFTEKVSCATKIEVVCRDEELERFANLLRDTAWTSRKGDGIIFIYDVQDAIRIRTGHRGEAALLSVNDKGNNI